MKCVAAEPKRSAYQNMAFALAVSFCCVGIACNQASPTPPAEADKGGMQRPLTSFRQLLTSSKTELQLHPGEDTRIPVRIQNPGTEKWVSAGKFPVNISYKWFKDGNMMAIEGERTPLPAEV